eukprot:1170844-Pyramimonas_sp.AAC.1
MDGGAGDGAVGPSMGQLSQRARRRRPLDGLSSFLLPVMRAGVPIVPAHVVPFAPGHGAGV